MKRKTVVLGLTGLLVVAIIGWFAWRESSRAAPSANKRVPIASETNASDRSTPEGVKHLFESEWPDLQGKNVPMRSYLGRPLVVNFWATWCVPCVEEMPELDAMSKELSSVQFVGIGIDTSHNIEQFAAKIPVSYPLLVAGHSAIATVRELGNAAGGLPFTVLFNAKGEIVEAILGQIKPTELRTKIKALPLN